MLYFHLQFTHQQKTYRKQQLVCPRIIVFLVFENNKLEYNINHIMIGLKNSSMEYNLHEPITDRHIMFWMWSHCDLTLWNRDRVSNYYSTGQLQVASAECAFSDFAKPECRYTADLFWALFFPQELRKTLKISKNKAKSK